MEACAGAGPCLVAGADGCRKGWVVAFAEAGAQGLRLRQPRVVPDFAALLAATADSAAVAVDIPIGLSEDGRRLADFAARACIGRRRSSVFPAPPRFCLNGAGYAEANQTSKVRFGRGLQRQTFNILPKICEADACMMPAMQDRLVESHPEVSFWALAQRMLPHAKHKPDGLAERLRLLHGIYGPGLGDLAAPAGAALDDLYDACVLAWTAARLASGTAVHLPEEPQLDSRGLRMEIVY